MLKHQLVYDAIEARIQKRGPDSQQFLHNIQNRR